MRGTALFWLLGAGVAFLVTAGAFLLLASIATRPAAPEAGRIPNPQAASQTSGGTFVEVDEDSLSALETAPDQRLAVRVRNVGDAPLSGVVVDLAVYPAGLPAGGAPRAYRREVGEVPVGRTAEVEFTVDLSAAERPDEGREGEERTYLEARASSETEPGDADAKTIVLAPAGG